MEPSKMGGYMSYFVENTVMVMVSGYVCQFIGYNAWFNYTIYRIIFKRVRSAFHQNSGESLCNENFHHSYFFIRIFNHMGKIFTLIPSYAFEEGGLTMISRYCTV